MLWSRSDHIGGVDLEVLRGSGGALESIAGGALDFAYGAVSLGALLVGRACLGA